eukprot:g17653.t1
MSTVFFPVSRWVCSLGRIRPGKDASGAVVVYRMIHWFVEGCLAPVCSAESTASRNHDSFRVFFESSDGVPKMHCYAGRGIRDAPPSAMEINGDTLRGLQPYGGVEELLYEWMVQEKGGVLNMFLVSLGRSGHGNSPTDAVVLSATLLLLHWLGFAECGCIVRTLSATKKEEWWRPFSPSGRSLGECFELVMIGPSETFQLGVLVGTTPCLVLDFAFRGWCGWWCCCPHAELISYKDNRLIQLNPSISKLDFDCGVGGVSGQPGAVDERRLDFQLLICSVTFVVMLAFLSACAFELTHLTLVWVGALFAARTLKLFVALGGQGK